jgi:hypothetical protein
MAKLREKYDYINICPDGNDGMKYLLLRDQFYWSKRYRKGIKAGAGFKYNGADWVSDLEEEGGNMSKGPLFHDVLIINAVWEDLTPVSNWQASMILRDILKAEGHHVRKRTWFVMTFLFGGANLKKKNGWFFSWKKAP